MLEGFQPLTRARQTATVLGLIYAVAGTVGFAVSGFDAFAAPRGDLLMFFTVNPLQNLIHLVLGSWLVAAAQAGEAKARSACVSASVVFALLGLAGIYAGASRPDYNFLNANTSVNVAHLMSAAGALLALRPGSRHLG